MSLFGSNRDDRRRRNLAEDLASESFATPATAASKPAGTGERYTAAGRREHRRHTSDFIPRHGLSLTMWLVIGVATAAGLLAGFIKLGGESGSASGLTPLFDATQGGSLAGWFSSLLFSLAAAGSVLVYSIRRHRADDYRGSYRLWLWCAAAWLVMSIDATANLHTPFSTVMAQLTGWAMLGGAMWWIGVWGSILAILALRLLLEVRECKTATLGFTLVFSLWAAALATDYGWLPRGEHALLVGIGGRLLGQVFLILSVAFYARYVLLDAEGLLKARPAKPKREKRARKAKPEVATDEDMPRKSESSKTGRVDSAHKAGTQAATGPLASHVNRPNTSTNGGSSSSYSGGGSYASDSAASNRYANRDEDEEDRYSDRRSGQNRYDDEDTDDSDDNGNRKLSKAERKRLRKQMRRQ